MLIQDLRIRQPDFNGMKYLVATFQVPWGKHLNYDIIVIKKKKTHNLCEDVILLHFASW